MENTRAFWEGKKNGVILDNITIALSVLANRELDEVDADRMIAVTEQAMRVSRMVP